MTQRKLIGIIFFAFFFMVLGKNLSFIPEFSFKKTNGEDLQKNIEGYVAKQKGSYGIYYRNLKTDESFSLNGRQTFTGASVNKMPIVAVLYYLDSKKEISLDDRVTIQEKDIQDYGTGSLRYAKPGATFSLRNLAKLSIQQSDNTAAHILGVKIGTDKTQKIINEWGLRQTNMKNNKTSAYDMYLLFNKIYKGEVADESQTLELLEFLSKSDFEDRLPLLLPKGTIIYHKTGDAEGFVHDLGIIETEKGAYFLGVMTSDIGDTEEETKATISEISKKVFDSLNN